MAKETEVGPRGKEEPKKVSRREFVKGATVGAAGIAAAGALASCAPAPTPTPTTAPVATPAPTPAATTAPVATPAAVAETKDYDVVVVGAGAAGMWAALEATEAGAKVALLEKNESVMFSGCCLCGGGVLGSNTKAQQKEGIQDTAEAHFRDHMRISRFTADAELSRVFCEESGKVVDWLADHGVPLSLTPFVLNHETTTPRAHWTAGSGGKPFAEALIKAIEDKGIEVFYLTPGKELLTDGEGRVTGVMAEAEDGKAIQFNAKAVVLCCGGFPNNHAMLTQYGFAHSEGIPGAPGCTGDGIAMATEVGAVCEDMEWGMTYYWLKGSILGGFVPGEMLMVNSDGERFVGEHSGYMLVLPRVQDQPDGVVYAIFDSKIVAKKEYKDDALKEAEAKGLLQRAATLDELARLILVEPLALQETIKTYNAYATAGKDEQFGKPAEMLMPIATPDFYAARVWLPKPTLTYGGVTINAKAQVLNAKAQPIPGMYAAGDDTAGLLGRYYPGSGTAIGTAMVFGRIAGRNAAGEKV